MEFDRFGSLAVAIVVLRAASRRELPSGDTTAARPGAAATTVHRALDEAAHVVAEVARIAGPEAERALADLAENPAGQNEQAALERWITPLFATEVEFQARLLHALDGVAVFRRSGADIVVEILGAGTSIVLPRIVRERNRITPASHPFVRGEDELADALKPLEGRAGAVVIASAVGRAGLGRTEFGRAIGHRMALGGSSGVQLEIALSVPDPARPGRPIRRAAEDVVLELLLALGARRAEIPPGLAARRALYRAKLAGARPFLLIDDAADAAQVRPLLPSEDAAVVVTAREEIIGLTGRRIPAVTMTPFTRRQSVELLLAATSGRDEALPAVAEHIADLCEHVPLAVVVMAGRLSAAADPAALPARLAAERRGAGARAPHDRAVLAALRVALADADPPQRTVLFAAALLGAPWLDLRAVCVATGLNAGRATAALDRLVRLRLMEPYGPVRGKWRLHPLIAELLSREVPAEVAARRERIVGRFAGLYLRRMRALLALLDAPPRRRDPVLAAWAEAQVEGQRAALMAALRAAMAVRLWDAARGLAGVIVKLLGRLGEWPETVPSLEAAVETARTTGDRTLEARAFTLLGEHAERRGHHEQAEALHERASELDPQNRPDLGGWKDESPVPSPEAPEGGAPADGGAGGGTAAGSGGDPGNGGPGRGSPSGGGRSGGSGGGAGGGKAPAIRLNRAASIGRGEDAGPTGPRTFGGR